LYHAHEIISLQIAEYYRIRSSKELICYMLILIKGRGYWMHQRKMLGVQKVYCCYGYENTSGGVQGG
jgi:hypothetical protein